LGDNQDYIVLSHKSFSLENHKLELDQNVKQYFDFCKSQNINDSDAVVLSKFAASLNQMSKPNETMT